MECVGATRKKEAAVGQESPFLSSKVSQSSPAHSPAAEMEKGASGGVYGISRQAENFTPPLLKLIRMIQLELLMDEKAV